MDERLKREILEKGINKRNHKIKNTWSELALEYKDYFNNGEDLRQFIKRELKKQNKLPKKIECIDNSTQKKINELDMKIIEFRKEKIKFQDQRRELRKIERHWGRAEHLYDEIKKSIDNVKPIEQLKIVKPIASDKEGMLILSDFHIGLACSNYWNKFNKDILLKRVNKLLNKTIEYGKLNKINKLHIICLGDLVNGIIHVTSRIANAENVIQQTQLAAEILSCMVSKLSQEFAEIYMYNTIGNHDRVVMNKKESIADENFMLLIPWYLKARLKNISNIKFINNEYDNQIIVANICNKYVFGVHGDRDKVKNVVQNLSLMLKLFPSMVVMGHVHHSEENEVFSVPIVVNSSLSGVDSYAKDLRMTSMPSQKLIIFENTDDWRVCTYNINLG